MSKICGEFPRYDDKHLRKVTSFLEIMASIHDTMTIVVVCPAFFCTSFVQFNLSFTVGKYKIWEDGIRIDLIRNEKN